MKTWLALLPLSAALAAAPQTAAPKSAASLAFLAGCWEGRQGEAQLQEHWMGPAGGSLLGISRVVAGGRTVFSEFMEIRELASGDVVMNVMLGMGKAPVAFKLTEAGPATATFENPEHDFPQRLRYWKSEDGALLARIDGKDQGKPKAEDFRFTKGSCD